MLKTQQCRKWLKAIKFPCLDDQSAIEAGFKPLRPHHNMTPSGNQGKRHY